MMTRRHSRDPAVRVHAMADVHRVPGGALRASRLRTCLIGNRDGTCDQPRIAIACIGDERLGIDESEDDQHQDGDVATGHLSEGQERHRDNSKLISRALTARVKTSTFI